MTPPNPKTLKKRPDWQQKAETMVDVCEQIEAANEEFGEKATQLTSFIVGAEDWFKGLKYKMPSMIDCEGEDGSKLGFQRVPGSRWALVVLRVNPNNHEQVATIPLATAPLVLKVAVAGKIPQLIKQHREQQLVLIGEIDALAETINAARDHGIFKDSQPEEFTEDTKHERPERP